MDPLTNRDHSADTKTALLDAAERLFADSGITASSLRAITGKAGVNLASVNYHFGSKEGLVRAVFARRIGPLNKERLRLLDRCEEDDHGRPELDCLLHAFIQPAVEMMMSEDAGDRQFVKLMGRTLFEPTSDMRSLMVDEFREIAERFTSTITAVFPHASTHEIRWRFHFMVGALAHTVAASHLVSHRLECLEISEEESVQALTERLVNFLRSGWAGLERFREAERREPQ